MGHFAVTLLVLSLGTAALAVNNQFGLGYINNILECGSVQNIAVQPGPPSTIWRPQSSGYNLPHGRRDDQLLIDFLGFQRNQDATSISERTGPADIRTFPTSYVAPTVESVFANTNIAPGTSPADIMEILDFIRINEIGICRLAANWTDLGETYFPRYYAGTYCEARDCSIPANQACSPVIDDINFYDLTVLRWDFCYNLQTNWFEFGWRKVRIPRVNSCSCSC